MLTTRPNTMEGKTAIMAKPAAQNNHSTPAKPKRDSDQKTVMIVDDHPIICQGLAQLINQERDLKVCAQAHNAEDAIEIIKVQKPDVVIADLSMGGFDGIRLVKMIKEQFAMLPVLVLSVHDESLYAERVLRAGAKGYVMKQEATEKIMRAIRQVIKGQLYVSDQLAEKMLEKHIHTSSLPSKSPIERLSDRELEVFQLIGKGLGTRQIAEKLHRSVKTIETYRANIKEKLKLENNSELVQRAVHWMQNEE